MAYPHASNSENSESQLQQHFASLAYPNELPSQHYCFFVSLESTTSVSESPMVKAFKVLILLEFLWLAPIKSVILVWDTWYAFVFLHDACHDSLTLFSVQFSVDRADIQWIQYSFDKFFPHSLAASVRIFRERDSRLFRLLIAFSKPDLSVESHHNPHKLTSLRNFRRKPGDRAAKRKLFPIKCFQK